MTPLQQVRERRKLSRKELAAALQIDYTHLFRVEKGDSQASPELAERIALYFGHEVTELQILYPERYQTDLKLPEAVNA
jgi:putative transcriptional regulator